MIPTESEITRDVVGDDAPDASPERRPGVPMEAEHPRPVGGAHWTEPERQPDPGNILKRSDLTELTPVFGTAIPPRGLSGLMRRAAYAIPEHRTTHWLVLLLADRVDALEHRAARILPFALPVAVVGGLALLAFGRHRRRRSSWLRRVMPT
ncbi:MAG: hypothetical protein KF850_00700 [Labilithrix sp.]|nr:hypothetical protein [Labilithrix sp.]